MADELKVVLNPLITQMDETIAALEFLSISVRMRGSVGAALDWQNIDSPTKRLAQDFMGHRELNQSVFYNGLLTSSIAAFEDFLRNIIKAATKIQAKKVATFKDLGEKAANRHFKASGRLLSRVHDNPEFLQVNLYEVARRLATCKPEAELFELNDIAIANIPKLTEMSEFIECLNDFHFNINFDELGKSRIVQEALGTSGVRNTGKEIKTSLDIAINRRNRIAHTGAETSDVTQQYLIDTIKLIKALACSICDCLGTQIKA